MNTAPHGTCSGLHQRHWFTTYGQRGHAEAWCQRCGTANPTCVRCGASTTVQANGDAVCAYGHRHAHADHPMRRIR